MDKEKKLKVAIALCFVFMAIEVAGGLLSGSLAILTDAAHLLTDVVGFAIALMAVYLTKMKASSKYTFGMARAEVLAALISTLTIWVLTIFLCIEAYDRTIAWFKGEAEPVNGPLMFIVALFGIAVNVVLYFVLGGEHGHMHSHDHGHAAYDEIASDHGHSHGHSSSSTPHQDQGFSYQQNHGKKTRDGYTEIDRHDHDHDHGHGHDHAHGHGHAENEHVALARSPSDRVLDVAMPSYGSVEEGMSSFSIAPTVDQHRHEDVNLKAAVLHVITDFVQAVGVAVAGAIIWWKPHWQVVDPMCTFLFSILVIWSTVNMLRSVMSILLEGVPPHIDFEEVKRRLSAIPGVQDVHDLHIWAISSGRIVLTAHLRADNPAAALETANKICTGMGIFHCTFQVQLDDDQTCHSTSCANGACA